MQTWVLRSFKLQASLVLCAFTKKKKKAVVIPLLVAVLCE